MNRRFFLRAVAATAVVPMLPFDAMAASDGLVLTRSEWRPSREGEPGYQPGSDHLINYFAIWYIPRFKSYLYGFSLGNPSDNMDLRRMIESDGREQARVYYRDRIRREA